MKALILDDEKPICHIIASVIEHWGVRYDIFFDPLQAIAALKEAWDYDFAFVDIGLPNMDGLAFSKHFKTRCPEADIVFITGAGGYEEAVQAIRIGAYDFLRKAFGRTEISMCIARLVEKRELYEAQKRKEMLDFANHVALQLMHELRNPLTAIGGFSRRASVGKCSQDQVKEYTKIIFDQSLRLERVLSKVLAYLRAGEGPTTKDACASVKTAINA